MSEESAFPTTHAGSFRYQLVTIGMWALVLILGAGAGWLLGVLFRLGRLLASDW